MRLLGTRSHIPSPQHAGPAKSSLESVVYYDQVVAEYTAWYHTESPLGYALRVRQQRVVELLDQPGGRILDVGCGPGMLASELLHQGYEFWGIDASSGMIQQCRKQFGTVARAHFAVGDAVHLPFANEFFDVVVCIGVLDRLQANEAALKEMARVVKPNGTLVISFPNLVSPYAAWKNFAFYPTVALLRPLYYRLVKRPQPPTLYSRSGGSKLLYLLSSFAKLRTERSPGELMARYKVQVTNIVYYNFNVFLSPLDELFPRFSMKITERLERLRFGRLKWLGAGFVIKARKSV